MGQVVLEIPQNINRTFRIDTEERAAEIIEQLENDREAKIKRAIESGAIRLPTAKFGDEDNEILGIWADREESGQEIARKIREANRKIT